MNSDFSEIYDSYVEFLEQHRVSQIHDERFLQSQLISRLAFVSSQIKDLDIATHRQIVEHGNTIGNSAAECILEAEATLLELAELSGSELMELASIARRDFMRIPTSFVHPYLEYNEAISREFLNEVILKISDSNAVINASEIIEDLEELQECLRNGLPAIDDEIQQQIYYKDRQMNYMKAEVFPILEYSLRFFREGTEAIIASLPNCN